METREFDFENVTVERIDNLWKLEIEFPERNIIMYFENKKSAVDFCCNNKVFVYNYESLF